MRRNLHEHYDQLTPQEREFVDEAMKRIFDLQKELRADHSGFAPSLLGTDPAEEATDGISKWVIASRPKT